MKSSEALRRARQLVASGQTTFVCCALQNVVTSVGQHPPQVVGRLQQLFKPPQTTIHGWLVCNSAEFNLWNEECTVDYWRTIRDYRLRWIDWMIEGYEKAGD